MNFSSFTHYVEVALLLGIELQNVKIRFLSQVKSFHYFKLEIHAQFALTLSSKSLKYDASLPDIKQKTKLTQETKNKQN